MMRLIPLVVSLSIAFWTASTESMNETVDPPEEISPVVYGREGDRVGLGCEMGA